MIRTAILDYGVGNLRSVYNAVKEIGGDPHIVNSVLSRPDCSHIILPGQGAFRQLDSSVVGPLTACREIGKPILGICLGMQLMCESSEEAPGVRGLGWFPYRVERLKAARLPHVGWNTVRWGTECDYYFCHSYGITAFQKDHRPLGLTIYEDQEFIAALRTANLWAVQFHPEKSEKAGLEFLRRFLNQ